MAVLSPRRPALPALSADSAGPASPATIPVGRGRVAGVLRCLALALAVGLFLPALDPIAGAEPRPLSEAEALALFFQRNLDLMVAHFEIDRADAEQLIAAAIPNPQLAVGTYEMSPAMNFKAKVDGGFGPAYSVTVSQLLETAGKRGLRMEISRLGREAVEAEFKDTVRQLANLVRHAYFDLLLAQKTRDLAEGNFRRYGEIVRANRLRLEAGDIAPADLMRVEVESLKAQGELDTAEAAYRKAQTELARLLNWPERSLDFAAAESWPDAAGYLDRNEAALLERAYRQRPDLSSALTRARQAERDLELARKLVIPDVTVAGTYQGDPGNVVYHTGGFALSLPIPLFYQYQGEVGKAVAHLNDARLQVEQTRQSIRAEVVAAHAALRSADAIADRFENEVRGRLEKVRAAAEFAYSKGAASLLELIDAERSYRSMMQDYYSALTGRTLAAADLAKAVGEEPTP